MNTLRGSVGIPLLWLTTLLPTPGHLWSGTPIQLQPAVTLEADAAPLDLGDHAIPCVADWNGDGLPDLLLGYRAADKVAVFYNVGTRTQPVFASSTNLQAAGVDICWPSVACGAPAPWVCDYDQDGTRDLLVGTGLEGQVCFYRNVGTDAQPLLGAGVLLTVGPAVLTVPARATPYVHDWDEDGLPDLLCGAGDGRVYFFRNTGTAQSPAYASAALIQAGGAPLDLGDRSVVRVWDWDGDGLKDLIGSASYNVSWCRNTNRNSAPVLQAPVALQAPAAGTGLTNISTGYRMRLEVVDWNGDSVPDVLIGRDNGQVNVYAGYRFALAPPEWVSPGQLVLRWNSAPFLNYQVLAGPSPDPASLVPATPLASQGTFTSWTNSPEDTTRFFRVEVVP